MGTERRQAARHHYDLEVDLHARDQRVRLHAVDVSRHGMFLATAAPPPLHHAVLLTVRLKGGPFETMATVVRRVEAAGTPGTPGAGHGVGVKLFCLGADAKTRWDRFVGTFEDEELLLPMRAAPPDAACFLVQPDDPRGLVEFFARNVGKNRTLYVSPALRRVGAEVHMVLVHPVSGEELALRATVVEWNPDHPLRMGVRFDPIPAGMRRAFQKFVGPMPPQIEPKKPILAPPLVSAERPRWTEYAFYSPKLKTDEIDPSPEELDVIEGQLLEHPGLEGVDKRELFDFAWVNEEDTEP